ncbi:MAG: ABC transporter permease [Thiotrichales bacterium]|nr:ABC transporter permease [Thiotrichales bacterium]
MMLNLAMRSMLNRKVTVLLTVSAIAFSVTLLLAVEKIRNEAKESFANTISGTDLIVGARSGSVQLLLYSVFRIGNATNNISWESYQELTDQKQVAWSIPISLGDSHRGYRVLGTTDAYFEHFRYAKTKNLEFIQGQQFQDVFETVLGADVAEQLEYNLGDEIVIAHGIGNVGITQHKDRPFKVVGILKKTGTPVDRTVHVSLQGIEAIHLGWQGGVPMRGLKISKDQIRQLELEPKAITAFMLGLNSKISIFKIQREINEYEKEALLAILPGVALQELWGLMGVAEQALLIVSVFVVITGLIGMLTMILSSLNERRREMAILRSVGARPAHIFSLMISEAGVLAMLGAALGVIMLYALMLISQPFLESEYGIHITIGMLSQYDFGLLGIIVCAGFIVGLVPAIRAYRQSLSDGMTIRV